jgi:hypothetical protein
VIYLLFNWGSSSDRHLDRPAWIALLEGRDP